ncbi:MAG TPA: sigma-70 family RNA polymerase sigma factor [Gemmata sp.]
MNTLFGTEKPPALNTLTEPERMALVDSVKRTCANEARKAARANPAHEFEDLEQEALLAAVEASRRWCPDLKTKFNTYATSCIRRHLANVTTTYRGEGVTHIEGWDAVTTPDRSGVEEEDAVKELDEVQSEALTRLGEPARSIVTLIVVNGLSPEQVAVQLDRSVKDVKLIARNAAKALPRELARAAAPNLFTAGVA